jgi:hypothetical protein
MTGKAYTRLDLGGGRIVNRRTAAMLREVERVTGLPLRVFQGSYNTSVSASGGTHAGGGVVDVWPAPPGRTATKYEVRRVVEVMRRKGFAAWHRTPEQGPWGHHIHAVSIDDRELSPAAARQVEAYRAGRNGLANNGPDDGPRVPIRPWELVRRVLAVRFATAELERWRKAHA